MTRTSDVRTGVPPAASGRLRAPGRIQGGHIGLFWRLLIPNAAVLSAASVVLIIAPPNGRVLVVLAGLASMLAINFVLMRHAFAPLERLSSLMQRVDPLQPGERVAIEGARSEVSMLAETFNEMLERLEIERRESGRRAMLAQEAERRRVATDLHDEIGQSLTALLLQLKHVAETEHPGSPAIRDLVAAAEAILGEVRSVARRLRRPSRDARARIARRRDAAGDLESS